MGSNPTLSAIVFVRFEIFNLQSLFRNFIEFSRLSMSKSLSIRTTVAMAAIAIAMLGLLAVDSAAQKKRRPAKHLAVCGNPNSACPSAVTFEPYDLPFRMPASAVIYDTDFFYAVILKSVPSPADDCDHFIPEPDRLAAQVLFPNQKVFTSRCPEPGRLSYSNTSPNAQFMAVYAGTTLADANRMLATVLATRKFAGANIRRMRAMMNGT